MRVRRVFHESFNWKKIRRRLCWQSLAECKHGGRILTRIVFLPTHISPTFSFLYNILTSWIIFSRILFCLIFLLFFRLRSLSWLSSYRPFSNCCLREEISFRFLYSLWFSKTIGCFWYRSAYWRYKTRFGSYVCLNKLSALKIKTYLCLRPESIVVRGHPFKCSHFFWWSASSS